MTNFIVMWQRDGDEGFDFINAGDRDSAIDEWLKKESGWHPHGKLIKMIVVDTHYTMQVPFEVDSMSDYYYGDKP